MSKDILRGFGPDSPNVQRPSASSGGQMHPKDISYSPPVGPKNISDPKSPGLHGTNHGNCVDQGKH